METKANYVAVGAFVLVCVVALVVAVMWLAGAQYSQAYSYYQTYFTGPVTGLGRGTITRYNGIDVGRVANLEFDPSDPQRVIVTLQVQQGLNIREDSTASIETQGFTGGSYVEISGGTASSPLLMPKEGQKYAVIRAKQSTLQQLEQSAPEVVARLNIAATRIDELLDQHNRQAVAHILANLDATTAALARNSADIDATVANTRAATANLRDASHELKPTIDQVNLSVQKFGKVADDADALVKGDAVTQLGDLIGQMRRLLGSLTRVSDQLGHNPTVLLFGDRRKGYDPDASK